MNKLSTEVSKPEVIMPVATESFKDSQAAACRDHFFPSFFAWGEGGGSDLHLDRWYSERCWKTSLSEDLAMVVTIVVSNVEYVFLNDIVEMKKPLGEAVVAWLVVAADELNEVGTLR